MTSPTAKVFDNQDTSSSYKSKVVANVGGTAIALAVIAAAVLFWGMGLVSAILVTAGIMIVFAVAAVLFSAFLAPALALLFIPLAAVGYLVLGVFAIVGGFFRGFFGALLGKKAA